MSILMVGSNNDYKTLMHHILNEDGHKYDLVYASSPREGINRLMEHDDISLILLHLSEHGSKNFLNQMPLDYDDINILLISPRNVSDCMNLYHGCRKAPTDYLSMEYKDFFDKAIELVGKYHS